MKGVIDWNLEEQLKNILVDIIQQMQMNNETNNSKQTTNTWFGLIFLNNCLWFLDSLIKPQNNHQKQLKF